MKQIPLTQGLVALVDDEDYEWLSQFTWRASDHGHGKPKWYAVSDSIIPGFEDNKKRRKKKKPALRMHRVILGLKPGDKRVGHHKNDNGLDNRRENLEIVLTNVHNMMYSKNWTRHYGRT